MEQDTHEKIGPFIAQLRKEHQMTQRELAERLHITDKAVSKWERGLSCPDISLLPSIAKILDVTTSELLDGRRGKEEAKDVEQSVDNALQYAGASVVSRVKSLRGLWSTLFSLLLVLSGGVCALCDLLLSGGFTWSLIPILSIVLAWLVLFPVIRWGGNGVIGTLAALTVCILPFLYVLDLLIPAGGLVFSIGAPIAAVSAVYLWAVFSLFRRRRERKLLAGVLALLLMLPVDVAVNVVLKEPLLDPWDLLAFAILAILAAALWLRDRARREKSHR